AIEGGIPESVRGNPRLDVFRQHTERAVRVERLEADVPGVVRVEVSRVHEIRRDVGLRPPLEAERVVVALVVPRGGGEVKVMLSRVVKDRKKREAPGEVAAAPVERVAVYPPVVEPAEGPGRVLVEIGAGQRDA